MTECRVMETRICPPAHTCGDVCARFESDDPTPWQSTPSPSSPAYGAWLADQFVPVELPTNDYNPELDR